MAAFVKDWVTSAGDESEKAGLQGNSDNNNGKNNMYDEMFDGLTGSGSDQGGGCNKMEAWKQKLTKRELTYNKPIPIRRADGLETYKTVKIKTPHQGTHCVYVSTRKPPARAFVRSLQPTNQWHSFCVTGVPTGAPHSRAERTNQTRSNRR